MTVIPTDAPVMVTGGNGYIAGVLIRDLLNEGLTVHATLRDYLDPEEERKKKEKRRRNAEARKREEEKKKVEEAEERQRIGLPPKIVRDDDDDNDDDEPDEEEPPKEDPPYQYLLDLPGAKLRLKLFKADLLKGRAFAKAMEGCQVVFHVACPNPVKMKDSYNEVVAPAFKGTKNVLNQAKKVDTVKRVVVTSSLLAMYSDAMDVVDSGKQVIDESFWNETASLKYQPQAFAKTEAEKDAWDKLDKQDKWDLVTICPGLVLGPGLQCHRENASVKLITGFGNGDTKTPPLVPVSVVDVREVSRAHIEAAFRPEANGRYLVAEHESNLYELSQLLKEQYGNHDDADSNNFPDKPMAKSMLTTFGTWVGDNTMCRKFVKRSYGLPLKVDSSRSQRELGVYYRPLKDTLFDMADQIIEEGLWDKAHMAEEARLEKEEEERVKEEKKLARAGRKEIRLAREKEEREQAKLDKAAMKDINREEREREREERTAEKERVREEKRVAKERGGGEGQAEERAPMNSDSIV